MVDYPNEASSSQTPPPDLQKQIEDLRSEVARMRNSVSALLGDVTERASNLYDTAADTAIHVGGTVRSGVHSISETVQEKPVAISAAFVVGGLFGMLIGFALGHADRHRSLF